MNIFRHIESVEGYGILIDVIYNIVDGMVTPENMKTYRIKDGIVSEQMYVEPAYKMLYLVNMIDVIELTLGEDV